jgi:hypothetical protein
VRQTGGLKRRRRPGLLWLALLPACCVPLAGAEPSPLAAWRATVDGVGPIHLGMSLAQAQAAAGLPLTEQPPSADAAAWQACHYAWPGDGTQLRLELGLMIEQGLVTRIDVATDELPTRSGARVGDVAEGVAQRYADHLKSVPGPDGKPLYLIVFPDQPHQLVFEVQDGRISAYRIGQMPAVHYKEGCS